MAAACQHVYLIESAAKALSRRRGGADLTLIEAILIKLQGRPFYGISEAQRHTAPASSPGNYHTALKKIAPSIYDLPKCNQWLPNNNDK